MHKLKVRISIVCEPFNSVARDWKLSLHHTNLWSYVLEGQTLLSWLHVPWQSEAWFSQMANCMDEHIHECVGSEERGWFSVAGKSPKSAQSFFCAMVATCTFPSPCDVAGLYLATLPVSTLAPLGPLLAAKVPSPCRPSVLHRMVGESLGLQRLALWRWVRCCRWRLCVGSPSALFAACGELGIMAPRSSACPQMDSCASLSVMPKAGLAVAPHCAR